MIRVGHGYDLHRLAEGCPLFLGGKRITYVKGLVGHSDADALTHAVIDALLGAAALGSIGQHFPDNDPHYKNAESLKLLRQAVALVHESGFRVMNVDATIIAEEPRIEPYVEIICANLAEVLEVLPGAVSVKGKTNEGVGPEGRGEAIAVHAVALIESI